MKIVCLIALLLIIFSCNEKTEALVRLSGEAQGTTYSISYVSSERTDYKEAIDSVLKKIDLSLSTYLPASIISAINRNSDDIVLDDHFINVFNKANEVSEKTNGSFDITVAPIINAWGFGFTKKESVDSAMIDRLLQFVGYKMVKLDAGKIVKEKKEIMLDFNAIAQGYTVDVLSSFLESKGVINYFVELGGEVVARGKKSSGESWKVGIDRPDENTSGERSLQAIINLEDKALATSGNYRKYYVEDGKKFAHIIDPDTGYPAKHHLLSASVIAADCMTADAYATAFMVMGAEKAKAFLAQNKELDLQVYFIFDEDGVWKTYASDNLKAWMKELP